MKNEHKFLPATVPQNKFGKDLLNKLVEIAKGTQVTILTAKTPDQRYPHKTVGGVSEGILPHNDVLGLTDTVGVNIFRNLFTNENDEEAQEAFKKEILRPRSYPSYYVSEHNREEHEAFWQRKIPLRSSDCKDTSDVFSGGYRNDFVTSSPHDAEIVTLAVSKNRIHNKPIHDFIIQPFNTLEQGLEPMEINYLTPVDLSTLLTITRVGNEKLHEIDKEISELDLEFANTVLHLTALRNRIEALNNKRSEVSSQSSRALALSSTIVKRPQVYLGPNVDMNGEKLDYVDDVTFETSEGIKETSEFNEKVYRQMDKIEADLNAPDPEAVPM